MRKQKKGGQESLLAGAVERWGAADGPDDAIENVADWPILHALGAHGIMQLSVYGAALGGGPVKPAHLEIRAFTKSRRNSP